MTLPGVSEVERFRRVIARRLWLQFEDGKLGFLAEVLRRRIEASDQLGSTYLRLLETDESREELGAIAEELTVPETYFFRNIDQFHAFKDVVLPERMHRRGEQRSLRLMSAGCASGEEAYTLAILVREYAPLSAWDVSITAVDVNRTVLAKARRGVYTRWALRETPGDVEQRWFQRHGTGVSLDPSIRGSVVFAERNLADDDAELWRPDLYDAIFCRNVMMYFEPANAFALVTRLTHSLAPGGFLFLGHAETLRGLSDDYHLHHTHGTFYYQRKDGGETTRAMYADAGRSMPEPVAPSPVIDANDSWIEAIGHAAEHIETLTHSSALPSATPATLQSWDLGTALDFLRGERFAEALEVIRDLPSTSARDADVLLLHAVLLTHQGQLAEAEAVCARLLGFDEMNAGAHYVIALCRESSGDRRGAAEHDQIAVYLDPAFAMPRLHLGLLARRNGDRDAMRYELGRALVLLQREDASRLLLFGGGFSRETLLGLCRSELQTAGGPL